MANPLIALYCIFGAALLCEAFPKTGNVNSIIYFMDDDASSARTGRIHSNIDDLPYMVSMRMKPYDWMDAETCDAVVVARKWIITSARCCVKGCGRPYPNNKVSIRYGTSTSTTGGRVMQNVDSIILKEGYTFSSIENNLCLVKMTEDFKFDTNLQALRLPKGHVTYSEGYIGQISGWSTKSGPKSSRLATVTLPIITKSRCQILYKGASNDITDNFICAVTNDPNSCHGVSGSPLVVEGRLAGVVTTGFGCADSPGVYTMVYNHMDWIRRHIGSEEQETIGEVIPE